MKIKNLKITLILLSIVLCAGCGMNNKKVQLEISDTLNKSIALINKGDFKNAMNIIDSSESNSEDKEIMEISIELVDVITTGDNMGKSKLNLEKTEDIKKISENEYEVKIFLKGNYGNNIQEAEKMVKFVKKDGKWFAKVNKLSELLGDTYEQIESDIKLMSKAERKDFIRFMTVELKEDKEKTEDKK